MTVSDIFRVFEIGSRDVFVCAVSRYDGQEIVYPLRLVVGHWEMEAAIERGEEFTEFEVDKIYLDGERKIVVEVK